MTDPSRVRFIVEHYPQLQGLRLVPLGLVFYAVAAWHAGWLHWLPGVQDGNATGWFLGGLAFAIAVSYVIRGYYERMLGGIQFRPFRSGGPRMLAIGSVVVVSMILQDQFRWAVSVPLIVLGVVLGYVGVMQRRVRQHYLWIAAACLLMANIGAFGLTARTQQIMLDLLIACGLILAGVGDHFVLMSVLHPPGESTYVDAPV